MNEIPFIVGASNEVEVGNEIMRCYHEDLFYGNLFFAYISKGQHLIIVKYKNTDIYGLSLVTSGYTALIPKIPKENIEDFSVNCLSDIGGPKATIQKLKDLINNNN